MQQCFRFKLSYLGTVEYDTWGPMGSGILKLRVSVSEYERQIYNGNAAEFARDVEPVTGYITSIALPVSADLVRAFNNWRMEECAKANRAFDEFPHKYGEIPEDDELRKPHSIAKGWANYVLGKGWDLHVIA